jgi:acetyl-CoA C-acetyltransferase
VEEIAIVSAVRTAIGSFGGSLKDVPATTLGAEVVREAVRRVGLRGEQVDQVIFGNVIHTSTDDMYLARVIALQAGLPVSVPAYSVNRVCGSGLQAMASAAQSIMVGDAEIVVAGGVESMSRGPYWVEKARWGYRLGNETLVDAVIGGVTDPFMKVQMGVTAEFVAEEYKVTREDQDRFALDSHQKAVKAVTEGLFKEQIVPISVPVRKGPAIVFDTDEQPRSDTSLEKLAGLKTAFKADGTVTAGNSSALADGAAAVILMTRAKAESLGLRPLGVIVSYATAGVEPRFMGVGPVPAVEKALRRADLTMKDIDLIELNEAFAAQSLAVARELGIDPARLNVNGGAIALGHPLGATGGLITVKLLYELVRREANFGLLTLCIGGGQGMAVVLKRK